MSLFASIAAIVSLLLTADRKLPAGVHNCISYSGATGTLVLDFGFPWIVTFHLGNLCTNPDHSYFTMLFAQNVVTMLQSFLLLFSAFLHYIDIVLVCCGLLTGTSTCRTKPCKVCNKVLVRLMRLIVPS